MLPLEGVKVLDLTRLLPGGFATMILRDLGCEVVKVEEPFQGDPARLSQPEIGGVGAAHIFLNRGKKSLTLNLKRKEGQEVFYTLAKQSDVVIESFRPGVAKRLGIDYEMIRRINPEIVYCSITGYGQGSPYRDRPGHDLNYIAMSGLLGFEAEEGGIPEIPPVQIADLSGGSMAVMGILAALVEVKNHGEGKYIDISMMDTAIAWSLYIFAGRARLLNGNLARYSLYKTKDSRYLAVAALEQAFWEVFCKAIRKPNLAHDARLTEEEKKRQIAEAIGRRDLKTWREVFSKLDTCVSTVLSPTEVLSDLHVLGHSIFKEAEHGKTKLIRTPIAFQDAEVEIDTRAPVLGAHSEEILRRLGYDDREILHFRRSKII